MNTIWTSCTVRTAIIAAAVVLIVLFFLLLRRPMQRLVCANCASASDVECERCKCCHKNKLRIWTHLYYILGYFAFIVVGLITYIVVGRGQPSALEKYISFAATFSSLILAVIAIIYAIVSNQKGAEQYGRITDATVGISRVSGQLDASVEALASTSRTIEKSFSDMTRRLQRVEDITQETQRVAHDAFDKMANGIGGDPAKKMNLNVVEFCKRSSFYGQCALLACVYAVKHQKDFSAVDLVPTDKGYLYGFLMAAKACGIVDARRDGVDGVGIKVTRVDESVTKHIGKIIVERIEGQDASWAEDVKRIKDFFDEK